MATVGVVSGSLYRRTHSLSRLAWSWVGGRLAPFYIHQMNRVNCNDDSTINIVLVIIIIIIIIIIIMLSVTCCLHREHRVNSGMRHRLIVGGGALQVTVVTVTVTKRRHFQ